MSVFHAVKNKSIFGTCIYEVCLCILSTQLQVLLKMGSLYFVDVVIAIGSIYHCSLNEPPRGKTNNVVSDQV